MRSSRHSRTALRSTTDAADVIVAGGGHNGLVAACYLARAGLDVLVLEASELVGGMTATRRAFPEAPDHWINEGSIDVTLFNTTSIATDLELHRFGLRQLEVDPQGAFLDGDGGSLCLFRDVNRTLAEIRRFSTRDASTYLEFVEVSNAALDVLLRYMQCHPYRPSLAVLRAAFRVSLPGSRLRALGELIVSSEAELIDRFEHPMLRGALAGIVPMPSLGDDFSAYMHIYYALCHRVGVHRFQGGTAALPWALERCLAAHGGRVRTGASIDEILVGAGRVRGVRLAGGEALTAGTVLTNFSPKTVLTRLLPTGSLDPAIERRAAHIPTARTMTIKTDVAYDHRLELAQYQAQRPDDVDLRLPVWVYHTFEQLQQAEAQAKSGRLPDSIPTMVVIPTAIDPGQAPPAQDTLWLYSSYVPAASAERWEDLAPPAGDSIIRDLTGLVGGMDSGEIGRQVNGPPQLEQRFNAIDGNVFHVDPFVPRFGPLRPAPGLGGYRAPIEGLYFTGAGTHPAPGICGAPGKLAAGTVLRDLRHRATCGSAPAFGSDVIARTREDGALLPNPSEHGEATARSLAGAR